MRDNFDFVFSQLVGHEGAKHSLDPDDRGNWTGGKKGVGELAGSKYGVTPKVLGAHRRLGRPATREEIASITRAEAKAIFKAQYWDRVQGDALPSGLDYAVADFAYNSGEANAVKPLQRLLGVRVDGALGPVTLAALKRMPFGIIDEYCDARLAFLKTTYGWPKYGKGWTKRVEDVRAAAKRLWMHVKLPDVAPPAAIEGRSEQVTAPSRTAEARVGGSAALSAVAAGATEAAEKIAPFSETLAVVKWLLLGLTVVSVVVGLYLTWKRVREGNA